MAGEESKPVVTEEESDALTYDELEKQFHRVVQELMSDRTFDQFHEQYEALHGQLVKSHENNQVLIGQCRRMNSEVLSNASKISTIMQLSASDQRTIAGLRHEFEKAWKIVELSEEKEEKNREAIDEMKSEVQTLSRVIEQGGTEIGTQETSLQEITDAIALTKKEIKLQARQMENVKSKVNETKSDIENAQKAISDLSGKLQTSTDDLEKERVNAQSCSSEVEAIMSEMFAVTKGTKAMREQGEQLACDIANKKATIVELEQVFRARQNDIMSHEEDLLQIRTQMKEEKSILHHKSKLSERCCRQVDKYQKRLQYLETTYRDFSTQLKTILDQIALHKPEYDTAIEWRQGIQAERAQYRKSLDDYGRQELALRSDYTTGRLDSQAMRQQLDRELANSRVLRFKAELAAAETGAVEGRNAITTNEIMARKSELHKFQQNMAVLEAEMNTYEDRCSDARNGLMQINEEIRIREDAIGQNVKTLSDIRERQKHQDALTEAIQSERDLASRLVQAANRDNAETESENALIEHDIARMKEDIRRKDALCVRTHVLQKTRLAQVRVLSHNVADIERRIKEADSEVAELRSKSSRARCFVKEGGLDVRKQRQVLAAIVASRQTTERDTVTKIAERNLLTEKVRLLASLISRAHAAYQKLVEDVDAKMMDLGVEIDLQKRLMQVKRHSKVLRLECLRIEKSLLLEQGKVKGLEEEIEKPMSIHRWRFMEAANPELAEMTRMNATLRDRLNHLIHRLDRLKRVRDALQESADIQERHLEQGYGGNFDEERAYLNDLLREKNRLLHQMQTQAAQQGHTLAGTREGIMTVRVMVKQGKTELHETREKTAKIRAKTAIGRRPLAKLLQPAFDGTPKSEAKFVGGGFAVGGKVSAQLPGAERMTKTGRDPTVVAPGATPRGHLTNQKAPRMTPRGWSPTRQPLSPWLKTTRDEL
jgi:chromosome segregation ATPase